MWLIYASSHNLLFLLLLVSVIVLYKTKTCAFCSVASHVFHSVKRLISPELVKFVAIDASENDLPWAFTALAVPSVLYFHGSSSNNETRAFPMEKPLSVPNLLSFIVANLDAETRVKLALSICGRDCVQEEAAETDDGLDNILRPYLQQHNFKEEL